MRKILTAFFLSLYVFFSCACADVNPDTEIHRVIGGLYSLVPALSLSGETEPDIRSLQKYFADVPPGWDVRFERVNNDIWAGVPVGKYSTARKYLRSNSPSLGITDSPSGDSWMGSDFAWIKAGKIQKGKLIPSAIKAAQGSGNDSGTLFFSADGRNWWQSYPSFKGESAREILRLYGVKVSGLEKPKGERHSIYDEVKPSEVRKPAGMHSNRNRKFGESYDINMGDVIFSPIPRTEYRDNKF